MKITKIQQQKKQADRYSIYLDDKFWLGVSQEVLIQFNLYKDQTLDKDIMEQIIIAENNYKLYAKAINYLSFGLRSRKEMKDYLNKQVEHPENSHNLIDQIIERLQKQGYINDSEFAKSYVRTKAQLNYKGPRLLHQELINKGIQEQDILQGLDEYSDQEIRDNIEKLGEKFIQTKSNLPQKMLERKLYQHLINKGFENSFINEYLQELELDLDSQQESELLSREASKLFSKYSKKHSGFALKQKMSQALYSKGYAYDLISEWLEKHDKIFEKDGQ